MKTIRQTLLLLYLTLANAKDVDLPLCPKDIHYFPQNLPMHCRMPRNAPYPFPFPGKMPMGITMPPLSYQSPPPNKQPAPLQFQLPPGFPQPIFPPGLPGGPPPGMPGPMPMPMPMPMPVGPPGPPHKLPVIVMPFYSPDPAYVNKKNDKKHVRKRHKHFTDPDRRRPKPRNRYASSGDTSTYTDTSDTDNSDSSGSGGWWKGYKNHRRSNKRPKLRRKKHAKKKDLLTPIIQYVTKDGYVIFEKEISKGEANDWLNVKNNDKKDDIEVAFKEAEDMNENVEVNRDVEEVKITKEDVEDVEVTTQKVPLAPPIRRHRQNKALKGKPHPTKAQ